MAHLGNLSNLAERGLVPGKGDAIGFAYGAGLHDDAAPVLA
jgi:hypothetical protein